MFILQHIQKYFVPLCGVQCGGNTLHSLESSHPVDAPFAWAVIQAIEVIPIVAVRLGCDTSYRSQAIDAVRLGYRRKVQS